MLPCWLGRIYILEFVCHHFQPRLMGGTYNWEAYWGMFTIVEMLLYNVGSFWGNISYFRCCWFDFFLRCRAITGARWTTCSQCLEYTWYSMYLWGKTEVLWYIMYWNCKEYHMLLDHETTPQFLMLNLIRSYLQPYLSADWSRIDQGYRDLYKNAFLKFLILSS
jgi:hypothetical protein